jgi:hypothetical protein
MIMAYQTSTNHYETTKYIVDDAGTTPYATIQSAINAAYTAGVPATVFIRNGTYTENLTLYSTIFLECNEADTVTIIGTHTPPNAGSVSCTRVGFQSATDIISSAAAGTTVLKMIRCRFVVTNGYVYNLPNWTGQLNIRYCQDATTSVSNGIINNATGTSAVAISYSSIGAGTANSMTLPRALTIASSTIVCPIVLSGTGVSRVLGGSYFSGMITIADTANLYIANSTISTGVNTALTVTTATPITLENVVINTSNAVAIAGTGTVNFAEATFVNSKALAGTITEGLAGVVKTGEIYANTILRMEMTGFYSWAAAGPYFDDTTLGTFQLLVGGTGYIKGKVVTWVAQNITGMTSGATWFIYIDSTGTIGKTSARTDALFADNIVLFECLYDETTGTKLQHTVKENHEYKYPVSVSNFEHDVIGSVIENNNNGANITLSGTVKLTIAGDDVLADHGLATDIDDTGATAVTWNMMYLTAGGKWARNGAATDTFTSVYNNAGTITPLTGGRFGVYTLYVTKDDLNTTTPKYFAVINNAQYGSSGTASTAIANGTTTRASGELAALELCQLGYIIFRESTGAITTVTISKTTLRSTLSTGGTNTAALVLTDVSDFNGILSAADTNVQAALNTIDDLGLAGAGTTALYATTFDTNVAAAGTTLSGTTWAADGTDANIDLTLTPKGTGTISAVKAYSKTVGATAQAMLIDSAGLIGGLAGAANTVFVGGTKPSFTATPQCTSLTLTGVLNLPSSNAAYTAGTININGVNMLTQGTSNTNVIVGYDAGQVNNTTHTKETFIGYQAGRFASTSLTTDGAGFENVAIGYLAMGSGPTGNHNSNTSGNTAIGAYSLQRVGWNSGAQTAVGYQAGSYLQTNTCSANSILGYQALYQATAATNNCIMGQSSGAGLTSGTVTSNTLLGTNSGVAMSTGIVGYNTFIGALTGDVLTTGNIQYNTFIGYQAGHGYVATSVPTYCINIGYGVTGTATEDHVTRLGAATQTSCYIGGIYGVTPGATLNVALINSSGQMGSAATLAPSLGGKNTVSESTASNAVQMAINTTYVATSTDGATLVVYTLPATAAVGDQVKVIGKSTAFWKVAQNATDTIFYGAATSTPGNTGYATTAQIYASATFTCITASSIWVVTEFAGTITLV